MTSALLVIKGQFESARRFADIFGPVVAAAVGERKALLKKQYAKLSRMTHPDHALPAEVALATEVFAELSSLYRKAQKALEDETYEQAFTTLSGQATSTKVTITAGGREYYLDLTPFKEGDFSNIHLGEASDGTKVLAKISIDPTLNQYLVGEAALLMGVAKNKSVVKILPFLPRLLDTAVLTEGKNEQYRVNLYEYRPGFVSLTEIREVYKDGLPPVEAAWIWRRVLGQTLAASMLKSVHGAIVPDHVLVHPVTHEPLHIGWGHAVERPAERSAKIVTIIDRYQDWYPPEVFRKEVPTHQTDLYMAGKTMVYLLGGDVARNRFPSHVPEPIVRIVKRCLETEVARRPPDGLALMNDFFEVAKKLWGRKYQPLRLS